LININVSFLYTNNEISKRKKKKNTTHLKYLGINLTKEVKDLHPEKYKTLIKKTEGDSKK